MPAIAITGGIASGKSTFTADCSTRTAGRGNVRHGRLRPPAARSDDAGRLAAVRAAFGAGVFDAAERRGGPRGVARAVVFADPPPRRALEAILHPRVRAAGAVAAKNGCKSRRMRYC